MAAIECKSPREVGLMREAGKIVAEAHALARTMMQPGVVTQEINDEIDSLIRERGGVPTFLGQYDFPRSVCMSINEQVVHGIPGKRVLREGDVVSIDIGCTKRKFIGIGIVDVKAIRVTAKFNFPIFGITPIIKFCRSS